MQLPNKTATVVKPLSSFIRSALNESHNHEPEPYVKPKHISPRLEAKKPKLSEFYSYYVWVSSELRGDWYKGAPRLLF